MFQRSGVNWRDDAGDGPLRIVARYNRPKFVGLILEHPDAILVMDQQNRLGETALHLSARLCRATVALRLVQAMADPGVANSVGETAESMDLDGLLREAELDEAHAKRVEQGILLAAVQNHRRLRDAAEWRERLFVESEEGGRDAFAGYEEKERHDSGRDWMDDVAFQAAARVEADKRAQIAAYLEATARAKEEHRVKMAARQAETAREETEASQARTRRHALPAPSENVEDTRVTSRARDEARWVSFQSHLATVTTHGTGLRPDDIPWPSGPQDNPLLINSRGHPALVRSQLRAGLLRWHPDKFMQHIGAFLPEGVQRETALDRVKDISQQLNRLMECLSTKA